jgi:hypothetical protein
MPRTVSTASPCGPSFWQVRGAAFSSPSRAALLTLGTSEEHDQAAYLACFLTAQPKRSAERAVR